MDYGQFYELERYLFGIVRPRFLAHGRLSAFDFFCIVVWKANRARSRVARRLLAKGHRDLEAAVRELTTTIVAQPTRARLRYLCEDWGLNLPMASAILTVLYPDEFTVYDSRVCDLLGGFHRLYYTASFDRLWGGYQAYKQRVIEATTECLSLRDRYLWGKSFHDQLQSDIARGFGVGAR
jgi:hypothetical protein